MDSPRPGGPRTATVVAVVCVLAAAVYARSLAGGFLNWDDPEYLTANDEMQKPFGEAVSSVFGTFLTANYNPLQRLVYLVLWKSFGAHALPFRLVNLVLHAGCASLVFLVLAEWLRDRWAAALAAAAFAVHPANVENVAWIAETKTLLASLCGLGATWLWLRERRPAALAVFVVGLLAKTSIVVLPGLLLLLDLSRRRRPAWGWYAAFLVPAGVMAFVQMQAARGQGTIQGLHGGSVWTHAATSIAVLPAYLWTVVLPFSLMPRREFEPVTSFADVRFLAGVALLAAVARGLVRSWRAERRLVVAAPWFVVTLLTTLVVPIPILEADRYLYLGLPFVVGGALAWLLAKREKAARTAAIAWIVVLGVVGAWYAEAWRSSVTLWTWQLERRPSDSKAWYSLGTAFVEAGNADAARQSYEQVLRFEPAFHPAAEAVAVLDIAAGRAADAEKSMATLVASSPDYAPAWAVLATAREAQGRVEDARRAWREGLARAPHDAELRLEAERFEARHPAR